MSSASQPTIGPKQGTFLGHPLGLYVLFFTEMWERFSYYGMRALLILYMVNYFKWTQKEASIYYKVYTSFVYVTPIIGGFLADRYLGNRRAVIIGAVLMAIGHFLMAFEEFPIFLGALIFLILGNGMFKPNMSTQVGRLYPANDGRRDAAYTIFYMGINLGAFLAPLACGWLAQNTEGEYHSGFTAAGIGMVLGLVIYLLGQPLIQEIDPNAPADKDVPKGMPTDLEGATASPKAQADAITAGEQRQAVVTTPVPAPAGAAPGQKEGEPLTEAEADRTPSVLGEAASSIPVLLYILGGGAVLAAPAMFLLEWRDIWDSLMLAIGGACLGLVGFVCSQVRNAVLDRVLAILILGVFVIFFWGAFEQAGNVLNLWADKNTNKYLWKEMKAPEYPPTAGPKKKEEQAGKRDIWTRFSTMFYLKPPREDAGAKSWAQLIEDFFNPIATTYFQSINALAIFAIAPLFAAMWIYLDRNNMQPSIAMKMFLGLILMAGGVAVMIGAANEENHPSSVHWTGDLPRGLKVLDGDRVGFEHEGNEEPFHAGRLTLSGGELRVMGVLPDTERDNILEKTAPESFQKKVKELAEKSQKIEAVGKTESVTLDEVPPGFKMLYSGLKDTEVTYDEKTKTLTAHGPMKTREKKGLMVAASDPAFRQTLGKLFVESAQFRVSSWWLFWSYILATLGELCLSPVGLSMVSKLAPAKYATMLMGVWMLTSAFGNFVAGASGEYWGRIAPFDFFAWLAAIVTAAALVLLLLVPFVVRTMHGVK